MTEDDKSLDITGAGKLAQAIPEKGWQKLIDTACSTFSDIVAPITKTTAGLGGLIEARFDAMIDAQKVFAADALSNAREKVLNSEQTPNHKPKAKVLITAIENASLETDDELRDIWANLIANELLDDGIHPEFPLVLSRLSTNDAIVLTEIASHNEKNVVRVAAKMLSGIPFIGIGFTLATITSEPMDFSREHLGRLDLIRNIDGEWSLTFFGEEFVKAVTDPSYDASL